MPEEVNQVSAVPPPATTTEALGMLRAAMGYLTTADAAQMAAGEQAGCLQALEQVTAMGTAARTSILAAFTSAQGYCADADYSPRAWLINKTRITKGAAMSYTAWVGRAAAHPLVADTLAAGELSESYARTICTWTDKLPEDCRPDADAILLAAAGAGMDLRDLAALAAEIYARSLPDTPDSDKDEAFEDRSVRLETTFEGAGVLGGDLTPECAAVVGAVLDALSAPAGAEDTRTPGAAVPRWPAGGDAAAGRGGAAAGAGRAAGEGLGAHLAGRLAAAGRQLGAAGGVDRRGPRAVGRAPRRRLGRRQRGRGVAGRRRGRGGGVRRGDGPDRDRRGEPGGPGGPDPAVRPAR